MYRIFYIKLFFILITTSLYGQSPETDKMTSDSRETNVDQNQQNASLRGLITDENGNELQGASVVVAGTDKGVNTNERGQFYFDKLESEKVSIQASIMGYKTQIVDIDY